MGKGTISTELTKLAIILYHEGLCVDISPLNAAAGELKKSNPNQLSYNLQKLKIRIDDVPGNTRPNGLESLEAVLNVQITEKICAEKQIHNPIDIYNFSVEISGQAGENKVISSWHLDFDDKPSSEYIHPNYHLTHGGRAMKDVELGNVLLLPSPRLPYPPMDAILGIDFVLSNFIKIEKYNKLKSNSEYKAAVKNAQIRLWRPYMLALANHWCAFKNCPHFDTDNSLSNKYYPTLIT